MRNVPAQRRRHALSDEPWVLSRRYSGLQYADLPARGAHTPTRGADMVFRKEGAAYLTT